jgi:hypothetical protein
MPSNELVTRRTLQRRIAVNALTKPLNLGVLAVLVVAGIVLDLALVAIPIAVVAYLVLSAITFFDSGEAERVGQETYAKARGGEPVKRLDTSALDPRIAALLSQARESAAAIRSAIASAVHPFVDVTADVDGLVRAMETSARRAQLIATTLGQLAASGQDPRTLARRIEDLRPRAADPDVKALIADLTAQREATERLSGKLDRFEVGMQRINASLGLMQARLGEMSASEEEAAQRELARQSRELRERTDLLAESMAEVFADTGEGERVVVR